MSETVIEIDNLWKKYRLGTLGTGTLRHDFNRWLHRVRGKPDPYTKIDQAQWSVSADPQPLCSDPSLADDEMWALRGVSIEIKQGEILGIIGRNGAGKSTLLKILSRVTAPTSGEVRVRGRIASLLEVGTGFHPELTGTENIFMNGAILGMTNAEIRRKFDEIIAFAEVEKYLDTPVKRYSSGMYVRLAFAVAAHLDPEILIIDEVLAVGDVAFQKKCLGKMGKVATEGRTVLFVSHNLETLKQVCDRMVLLRDGRILKDGSVGQVIHEYVSLSAVSRNIVELTDRDNVSGFNGVRVKKVRLLNGVGETFAVPWNGRIHLKMEMEVTRTVPNVNFGLGITNLEGTGILTVHCTDTGDEPVMLHPGSYEIEVKLENPLRIGTYKLLIGAHEASARTSIFYIPDAIQFEVTSSGSTDHQYMDYNNGLVNGKSDWKVSASERTRTETHSKPLFGSANTTVISGDSNFESEKSTDKLYSR